MMMRRFNWLLRVVALWMCDGGGSNGACRKEEKGGL
jgi:hypothetical protein